MRPRLTVLAGSFLAVSMTAPLALAAAERYDITPLPFFNTRGAALSNHGVVTSGIAHPDGSVSLGQWSDGVLTDLGSPSGLPAEFNRVQPFGINDSGAVVGTVHGVASDIPSRTFVYNRGRITVLPLVDPADLGGAAIGINDKGEVVGYDKTPSKEEKGWLWSKGAYSSLPVTGNNTAALGINASGTIIGNRSLSFIRQLLAGELCCRGQQRGYVVNQQATQYLSGFVYAINDQGEAAGGVTTGGQSLAAVYKNGSATVILGPPSFAVGINLSAEVVGSYQPAEHDGRHVFIWSASSGAFDVTPDGFRYAEGAAINARGEVLAFGETTGGAFQYFLLSPRPNGVLKAKPMPRP